MKREDLLKYKVVINEKLEDGKYQDIAILVDKPMFLEKLAASRKKAGITKPLIDLVAIQETKIYPSYQELQRWYEDIIKKNPSIEYEVSSSSLDIIFELHYPLYYRDIVRHAIVFGYVAGQQPLVALLDREHKLQTPCVVIVPSIQTTNEEIKAALTQAKILINRHERTRIPIDEDTKSNIKLYRFCYWGKKFKVKKDNGKYIPKTNNQLANEWAKCSGNYNIDENTVLKGIKIYKKLLEQQPAI